MTANAELVKRLRTAWEPGPDSDQGRYVAGDRLEAADAIERLTRERDEAEKLAVKNSRLLAQNQVRAKALEEALDNIWEHAFSLESIIREGVYQSKECGNADAWVNADEGNYNGVWASYREEYQQARVALKRE